MKFSCQSCHAKYSIPDERVENKVVRLACQKCGAEIVVRGPVSSPALTQPPPAAAFRSTDVDDDEPEEPRETTRIANLSELETMRQRAIAEAAEAKAAEVKKKAKPPPPPADHDEELREWMTLVQSEQRGPFTVEEILAQTRAGALHEKSYVWKEGMPEWQRLGALAPFKSHFGPKPMPPAAVESGAARLPEFDIHAPVTASKKSSVQALASLNETQPGVRTDDFDTLFGPKDADKIPPPLIEQTGTDKHALMDDEPSGPNHLGEAPAEEIDHHSSVVRAPTRMFMRQAGLDARKRNQRVLIITIGAVVGVLLLLLLLDVIGVIELPGLGMAYNLVDAEKAEAPASQPAVVVSEEDRKRIRDQLMGKGKPAETETKEDEPQIGIVPPAPTRTNDAPVGLKAEQITQVVSANASAVKTCYERELKRGTSVRGKLVVAFSIANTGTVSQASVTTAELKDGELARCVVAAVRTWKFPRFSGDAVSVEYPFLLSPSE